MSDDIPAERARIEAQIEGRTLIDSLADTVAEDADVVASLDPAAE